MFADHLEPETVISLMKHPDIMPGLTDDFQYDPDLYAYAMQENVVFFLVKEENQAVGFLSFERKNRICYEMHGGFLPKFRGKYAKMAFKQAVQILAEHGVKKLIASIPEDNCPALWMAHTIGFEREGFNKQSTVRGGKLIGMVYLGMVL